MKIIQKHQTIILWVVALAVIAGAMLYFESDQLWKVEQKNLFLKSSLFMKEQLVVPGGLLIWLGTWFTQFLYYPWLGVLFICGWWLVLMTIVKRTFRISDRWAIVTLIPVALLLLTNMDMGYWIYILKLRGHFFVSTIGTTAVAALLWGFRLVPEKYHLRSVAIFLTCALGYPLIGIYGLAAALLMAIWSWRLGRKGEATLNSLVAVLGIAVVTLVCYRYIYHETNQANLLWAELPLFFVDKEYHTYYIPYYLLALFFVVLVVTYRLGEGKQMKKLYYWVCQAVVAAVLVGGVYTFWMKDGNFHRELAMQHRIAQLDWIGVLEVAADQPDEPTRAIVMMRNLALSRLGKQGDAMFLYRNGSKKYDSPIPMRLMMVCGPMLYYQYGQLNYSNRLCMEMGVEFGFRTEDYILLAKCALLEGDQPITRKYLHLLKQTMFYKDWAEETEALIGHPERFIEDPERGFITHMMHYDNALGGDKGYIERFLMTELSQSTDTSDPIFQEQCLLASLWIKDPKTFWYHFENYIRLHPDGPMPRYYQEAAYLFGKMMRKTNLDRMPFDPGIKKAFEQYTSSAKRYADGDIKVAREALYPFFGETFFYDYSTMSDLKEY